MLNHIADRIRIYLEEKNRAREQVLLRSRELIRCSSLSIRAVHRAELGVAREFLGEARTLVQDIKELGQPYPDLYHAGYAQDALKEYAEAHITYALINGFPLPDPDDLGVEYAAYLNGLGEAAGELRRHVLDLIRRDEVEKGEKILEAMDEIYHLLVTIDFPDALTGSLRHTTDMVRGVLERTRGDLTLALRQEKLQKALSALDEKLRVGD